MESWRLHMPRGMLLRGRRRSSHLPDPERKLTIDAYEAATGVQLSDPIALEEFLDYAEWFQRQAVPDIDSRRVVSVERREGSFALALEDGSTLRAGRVVVAAGITPFARWPRAFTDLPSDLVTHSEHHPDLARFEGRRVLVIGGGQSALETAALLAESGAQVEIVARATQLKWLRPHEPDRVRTKMRTFALPPTDLGGWRSAWIAAAPDLLRRLPATWQADVGRRCVSPAGAGWLRPRLADVPVALGRSVTAANAIDGEVRVVLDDGTERRADHVILGTGYEVDVANYEFLGRDLLAALDIVNGYPRLTTGYESSIPGLHFLGAPAALSFGPVTQFVVGSWHAAPTVTRRVLGKRQRAVRLSYKPRLPARLGGTL